MDPKTTIIDQQTDLTPWLLGPFQSMDIPPLNSPLSNILCPYAHNKSCVFDSDSNAHPVWTARSDYIYLRLELVLIPRLCGTFIRLLDVLEAMTMPI